MLLINVVMISRACVLTSFVQDCSLGRHKLNKFDGYYLGCILNHFKGPYKSITIEHVEDPPPQRFD